MGKFEDREINLSIHLSLSLSLSLFYFLLSRIFVASLRRIGFVNGIDRSIDRKADSLSRERVNGRSSIRVNQCKCIERIELNGIVSNATIRIRRNDASVRHINRVNNQT